MRRYLGAAAAAMLLISLWSTPAFALEVPEGEEIAAGIYVEDMNLEGMTHEEAKQLLEQHVSELCQTPVTVTFGGTPDEAGVLQTDKKLETTLGELGLSWENADLLDGVDQVGKRGNMIERYKQLKDLNEKNLVFELEYAIDKDAVAGFVETNALQFNQAVVDATIKKVGDSFEVTHSVVGLEVNLQETIDKLAAEALAWESKEPLVVEAVVLETQPKYSYEALSSIQFNMGSAHTGYWGAADRNTNISLGTSMINGAVVLPGETYSANAAMEPYTPERGWKKGGSYAPDGTVEYTYGGGICQISSTLYNAVLKAELGIVQRNNHSMVVGYLPYALDAAIADDVKDLKFRNDYDFPIYIEGVTAGGRLTFTIWGAQPGRDVRLSSVTTLNEAPTTKYIDDPNLPLGYEEVISEGHPRVKATSYKRVYDAEGKLIEETILSQDTYRMGQTLAKRGTNPDLIRLETGEIIHKNDLPPEPTPEVPPEVPETPDAGDETPTQNPGTSNLWQDLWDSLRP